MTKKKKRSVTNRRKKGFSKAQSGKQVKEKTWDEKALDHVRSPGYVGHVPDWPNCVFENS